MKNERWLAAALFGGAAAVFLAVVFQLAGMPFSEHTVQMVLAALTGVTVVVAWLAAPSMIRDALDPRGAVHGVGRGLGAGAVLTVGSGMLTGTLFMTRLVIRDALDQNGAPLLFRSGQSLGEGWSFILMGTVFGFGLSIPALLLGAPAGVWFYHIVLHHRGPNASPLSESA